jgi:hypothetical protein
LKVGKMKLKRVLKRKIPKPLPSPFLSCGPTQPDPFFFFSFSFASARFLSQAAGLSPSACAQAAQAAQRHPAGPNHHPPSFLFFVGR